MPYYTSIDMVPILVVQPTAPANRSYTHQVYGNAARCRGGGIYTAPNAGLQLTLVDSEVATSLDDLSAD